MHCNADRPTTANKTRYAQKVHVHVDTCACACLVVYSTHINRAHYATAEAHRLKVTLPSKRRLNDEAV